MELFVQLTHIVDFETGLHEDIYDDNLLSLMYIEYLYCIIYLERISYIQACWRGYVTRKEYQSRCHKLSFYPALQDIIDFGYSPPDQRYPLLCLGGCRYREGYASFHKLSSLKY